MHHRVYSKNVKEVQKDWDKRHLGLILSCIMGGGGGVLTGFEPMASAFALQYFTLFSCYKTLFFLAFFLLKLRFNCDGYIFISLVLSIAT